MFKNVIRLLLAQTVSCALALAPIISFGQQSNPGFVYGQVPTAQAWNSYFSAKLDYNANGLPVILGGTGSITGASALANLAGGMTSGQYLRGNGSGIVISAIQASDVPGLAGGAVGSIPYQSASNTTAYLAGNTTTTPQFLTSTGTGSVAQAPTYTGSTGTGGVVLAASPTITGTGTASFASVTSTTAAGTTATFTNVAATTKLSINTTLALSNAPTVSSCGTGASVSANNGTASFRVTVGSTGPSNCTINFAVNGAINWNCFAQNVTSIANAWVIRQSNTGFNSVTLTNYNAGAVTAWAASDVLAVSCFAYS